MVCQVRAPGCADPFLLCVSLDSLRYTVLCNSVKKQTPYLTNIELYDLGQDPAEVKDRCVTLLPECKVSWRKPTGLSCGHS